MGVRWELWGKTNGRPEYFADFPICLSPVADWVIGSHRCFLCCAPAVQTLANYSTYSLQVDT
jgi:hypothetical protein